MPSIGIFPSHSEEFRPGRAKQGSTTYYIIPEVPSGPTSQFSIPANRDRYTPWKTSVPLVIDQLVAEVTATSASNFRIGFYAADHDWQPIGAPLADSGSLSGASTGMKTYTPSTPIWIPPGRYVSVTNSDVAVELRVLSGGVGITPFGGTISSAFYVSRSYAAFTTPGTAWTTFEDSSLPIRHVVAYRIARL